MELKDFIKQVLADVTNAVSESRLDLKNGSIIAPSTSVRVQDGMVSQSKSASYTAKSSDIEFEVAITAEDTGGKQGRISVLSSVVGLGVGVDKKSSNTEMSRIKFSVPVIYSIN